MKKGFTLIELLAVIALLAIILMLAVPRLLTTFSESKSKLSFIQRRELRDAVELYLTDTCFTPINDEYECLFPINNESGKPVIQTGAILLEDFSEKGYLNSSRITDNCEGTIYIDDNKVDVSEIICSF